MPKRASDQAWSAADERRLAAGCRRGDPAALEQMFRANVRYVERVLGRLCGFTSELEDLVQHTFLEALRSLHRFRGEARVRTWITRIAVNVARHHLRDGGRRRARLTVVASEASAESRASRPFPELSIDSHRAARRLHAALDHLPEAQRVALILHLVEGHTVNECAALMGAGRSATRARLWMARRKLRTALRSDPYVRSLLGATDDSGADATEEGA